MRLPISAARLALGAGCLGLSALLTACPGPKPPSFSYTSLNFQFPETAKSDRLTLAAIYFEDAGTVKVLSSAPLYGPGETVKQGTLSLSGYQLDPLTTNPKCVTPFVGGETKGMQNVTVTPNTVRTCNVYFTLFRDDNGDRLPQRVEELYQTHTIYSYATEDFSYRFTSPDGKSTEAGSRVKGWSLVRHQVLQPSSAPGQYEVSMNSVPTADEGVTIRLTEPTNRLISQGLSGGTK